MGQILKDNFQSIIISFLLFLTIIYALSLIANYCNNKEAKSQPQADFTSLLGYIKFILTVTTAIIGLMVIVFTTVFWEDKSELEKVSKDAIEEVASNANIEIKGVEKKVNSRVNSELDKIFETPKIQKIIDDRARELAEEKIQDIVDEKVAELNRNIEISIAISEAAAKMRDGKYEGLEELQQISFTDSNTENRERAGKLLDAICQEMLDQGGYSAAINRDTIQIYPDSVRNKFIEEYETISNLYTNISRFHINTIQNRLNTINYFFGKRFSFCNLEEVEEWAKTEGIKFSIYALEEE